MTHNIGKKIPASAQHLPLRREAICFQIGALWPDASLGTMAGEITKKLAQCGMA